jgi:hypothetical protein
MADHHRSPPTVPQPLRDRRSRRFTIRKLDEMLKKCWQELVAKSEPRGK